MSKGPPRSSTREHWIRGGFTLIGVIITAAVTLIAAFIGRATDTIVVTVGAPPTSIQTVVVTAPVPPPTIAENPADNGGPPLPDGVTVRRTTGSDVITQRPGYGVDLDDNTSPNWNVGAGYTGGRDVWFADSANALNLGGDHAVVTGAVEYSTCARETAYAGGGIERGVLRAGEAICIRTDHGRYAIVTIVSASEQALQLRVTVWDPPVPS